MTYNNCSISYTKGKMYLRSKDPKEGYEPITYGDSKVVYHKYFDKVKGVLTKAEVLDREFDGRKLSFFEVTLVDGENVNRVSATLKNTMGNYTEEVKSLVSALHNAEFGTNVSLTVSKTDKNDKKYFNVYINYLDRLNENGKPQSTGFIPYKDIPLAKRETPSGITWDWNSVDEYYASRILEIESRSVKDSNAPTMMAEPIKVSF